MHAKGHEFDSRHFQKKKRIQKEFKKNRKEGKKENMLKKIRKDRKRRERVQMHWEERMQRKMVANDIRRPKEKREKAENQLNLKEGERDRSRTRVRNRCVESGNPRSVVRWFRRSGLQVRERALIGKLPGVYKISW